MIPIVYPKCRVPDVLQAHELFNKVTRLEITPATKPKICPASVLFPQQEVSHRSVLPTKEERLINYHVDVSEKLNSQFFL